MAAWSFAIWRAALALVRRLRAQQNSLATPMNEIIGTPILRERIRKFLPFFLTPSQSFRRRVALIAIAGSLSSAALLARADNMTSEQAREVLNELKQIRQLLERQQVGTPIAPQRAQPALQGGLAAPQPAIVDERVKLQITGGETIGRDDAPLTMVEYTDYQCPFCRQFHVTAFELIKKNYIDTGKLRFISRDFPLAFHENAMKASVASHCAGAQGKFWEFRHVMIVHADQLQVDKLLGYAKDLNLDVPRFQSCLADERGTAEIARSLAEGRAAGVDGTPTFVLGRIGADKTIEGARLMGAQPYAVFEAKLNELLDGAQRK
jgi:protein-disulfide isomerase